MDSLKLFLLFASILYTFFLLGPNSWPRRWRRLPPGPTPLPIISNILRFGHNPHRSLSNLARIYGPLMHLKLTRVHTVVASSPEMAREVLSKHDQACSNRPVPHVAHAVGHHEAAMIWLPVGSKWRKLRKISKEHMFTQHKLEASESLHQEKLRQLRDYREESRSRSRPVNFEEAALVTSLNMITTTLFSVDFASFDSDSPQREMKESIRGTMKISGTPNMADFFLILRMVDPQGLKRKTEVYFVKLVDKFDEIVSKRLQEREQASDSPKKKDLLEILLDLNQEDDAYLSLHEIKHLLFDLIVAATDTTMDSVHWAMAELIRNPLKLSKAKHELRTVIGEEATQVQESDIRKLPYLNAMIKESFRLHPPGPFLVPRKAESDVEINGYTVLADTSERVGHGKRPDRMARPGLVPARAVFRQQDRLQKPRFRAIPVRFGPADMPQASAGPLDGASFMVVTMIHKFDWKAGDNVDMDDVFGLSLHKARPLMAWPITKR